MRIKILFSKNLESVPNNVNHVNSYIHKCLGVDNDYHDKPSNYCVSKLNGGRMLDGGRNVDYSNGGFIIVTSNDEDFINQIIIGAMNNREYGFGMNFENLEFINETIYDGFNMFRTMDSGFMIKSDINGIRKYVTLDDKDFIEKLETHVKNKLSKIYNNLNFNGFKIELIDHSCNKIRRVFVKNTMNLGNVCVLKITSSKKIAEAIYNHGLGQSTGSGFGTIYKLENHNLYK